MLTIYGIKTCDTVRKARRWLDAAGVEYRFHDFRADGLAPEALDAWLDAIGWETLLNRRGTSWRQLDAATREGIDAASARRLMLENPTLIKRPVVEYPAGVVVGFDEGAYERLLTTS